MDPRTLAALISPLISELLLILLLFPSTDLSNSNSNENLFPLLHHFLSTSQIAASLALLSKKRKRTHLRGHDSTPDDAEPISRLGQLGQLRRVDSVDSPIPRGPDSFKLSFGMKPSTFEWLAALLEPLLDCRDPAGSPLNLSAETRLGIGLFRLSAGADYPELARRFNVSEPVSRFCVKHLCRVLCTNFRFWIAFPSPRELQTVSYEFENLTGMPNCCGVIDCARFNVLKNKQSIATQIVVDRSLRILSVFAGQNGEKGNPQILKSSSLYEDIELGNLLDSPPMYIDGVAVPQYLIGNGSGNGNGNGNYPLLPWLIVPFPDPKPGSNEENFNLAIDKMRSFGTKTIASLKNWGVLNKQVEADFKVAVAYIGACSILHNVLLMREDDSTLSDGLVDDCVVENPSCYVDTCVESTDERNAAAIRSALATRMKEIAK